MHQYIKELPNERYIDYITRIKILNRIFTKDIYTEKHHIIPKCMGGENIKENLIILLPEEHFIAHKLLAIENPDNKKLALAFSGMAFLKSEGQLRYNCTPEEFALAREKAAFAKKDIPLTNAHKDNISKSAKGHKPTFVKHHTNESKRKMSESWTDYNLNRKDYNRVSEHHKNFEFLTNGIEQHWFYGDDIELMKANGWYKGICKPRAKKVKTDKAAQAYSERGIKLRCTVWVHKGEEKHQIKVEELDLYYSLGFTKGMKD